MLRLASCVMKYTTLLLCGILGAVAFRLPTVCTYGTYVSDPFADVQEECKDCPEGKYRDTVQWDVQCKDCPAGQLSGAGSIGCDTPTQEIEVEEDADTSTVAAGGVGVAAGASIGIVYYTTTTS